MLLRGPPYSADHSTVADIVTRVFGPWPCSTGKRFGVSDILAVSKSVRQHEALNAAAPGPVSVHSVSVHAAYLRNSGNLKFFQCFHLNYALSNEQHHERTNQNKQRLHLYISSYLAR
jgi:hypothetical protein